MGRDHSALRKRWPLVALTCALLAAGSLTDLACASAEMLDGMFPPGGGEVIDTVTVSVQRTGPARITSADGQVVIEVPPLGVATTTLLTLSKVRLQEDGSASDALGYRLEPAGRIFERPVRITFGPGALPTPRPAEARVVQLDGHGSASWQALMRPETTSTELLGRSQHGGTFAVLDTTEASVVNVQPFSSTSEADVLLSRGDVAAARAAYAAVVSQNPLDARARLGHALSGVFLLADAAPVRNVLARCELPPLAPAALFGADGYIDHLAADRTGEAELTLDFGASPSSSLAEAVIARADSRQVTLRVEDDDHVGGPWVLSVSIDLERAGESYAFGEDIPASSFPGEIRLESPSALYQASAAALGSLHIDAAGRAPGQQLAVTLSALTLIDAEGGQVRVGGRVDDLIAMPPVPTHALFTTAADPGPPHRDPLAVLLDGCGESLTPAFLFAQVQLLAEELDAIADDLQVVLTEALAYDPSAPDNTREDPAEALEQALPSFLLNAPDDVPMNLRDVRLLIAGLRGVTAVSELVEPYRFFGHDDDGASLALAAFLEDHELAADAADGSVVLRDERALSAALLAADLSRNLLDSDLDRAALVALLAPLRSTLGTLIDEVVDALLQPPTSPGLFDLDSAHTGAFSDGLAAALQAFRASLGEEAVPVSVPANPGYSYLATMIFDQPPLRSDLVNAVGDAALVLVEVGDPEATSAAGRNPRPVPASGLIERLLGIALLLPPDPSGTSCRTDAACGGDGVVCDFAQATCAGDGSACTSSADCVPGDECRGLCARAAFAPVPTPDVERALGGERPAIVHESVWRALAPLIEAMPR